MASNIANIVFPGQFNPKIDKWSEYQERLLCALDAAGVTDENRNKARSLFLSQCGKETYSLIVSLLVPRRPTAVPFHDILAVLDKFFEPEVNEVLQAGKFHKRQQSQQESVQEYVAAIGLLGAQCNFVDLKRQLRDRLVLGVRDERLRRELVKGLTYEMAVQQCLNYQTTFCDLYPDNSSETKLTPSTVNEPMEIGRIKSDECQHCARTHGGGEKCPFMKARCFYCKRYGHITSACRKKRVKVHQVQCHSDEATSDKSENMMGVYVCSEKYSHPITTEVYIDGALVKMEVDSGASRTIISEDTFSKLWHTPPPLISTDIKLLTWTRDPLKVLVATHVRVSLGNKEAQCELLVVSGVGPSLLGRNWFTPLGIEILGVCWNDFETNSLITKFPNLFSETLGEYKGPEISLHLRSNAKPRFIKARPVPFPLRRQVDEELTRMVEANILTPVRYSEWATPLRLVKKDDGSLRICGDYRSTVNPAIEIDTYPLPAAVESFVRLSGGRIFSKIDLKLAYMQLKVDERTAMLLTLNTPLGLMKMNRLAFGVNAAPSIFQRIMANALSGLEGVACLLDDVAVAGRNVEEHNQRLHAVLKRLDDLGFHLNIKKCVFATNSITFLGHIIDANGLHPSPLKVQEIKDKPAPTNKETLRAFLGLYNFYEKFIPNRATLLEPLYRLLESKRPWTWGEAENTAFERAKKLLASDLTLTNYELDRELLLICDSSSYGLGAIIAHVMDDGSEKPITMASRTLQPHERRYGQIDKEALAIIFGLTKFHKFCVVSDLKPLVGLFNPGKLIPDQISPRMLRWALKLSCYDYIIKYRPGKALGNADALSRWTTTESADQIEKPVKEILLLEEQPEGWNLDALKIARETRKDGLLQKVLFHVLHGWPRSNNDPALQPFWSRREALSHSKGCLLWCNRVIVPRSLQREVLKLLHAPHAGIVQTKAFARGYVWWAGMDQQIERCVAECEQCQAVRNNPPRNPQTWIAPTKPWSRLHVWFCGTISRKDISCFD